MSESFHLEIHPFPHCLACPSPLVSVSWDCVHVRWVRRVRFDHWCSSAYGKEPGDRVPSDHLYLPQRLFLLLATSHPPKSGLPQSLGPRLPWFGFGSGGGWIMCVTSTISPGTSISHHPWPPYFPESSSVTLKALQGCPWDILPVFLLKQCLLRSMSKHLGFGFWFRVCQCFHLQGEVFLLMCWRDKIRQSSPNYTVWKSSLEAGIHLGILEPRRAGRVNICWMTQSVLIQRVWNQYRWSILSISFEWVP